MGRDAGRAGRASTRAPGRGIPARRLAMTRPVAVTRLLLVHHGESTWNADGRWQGQADPPLSELGEQQAADAAVHVAPIDAVWSSNLARARRTAMIIAGARGVDVRVDPRLRE